MDKITLCISLPHVSNIVPLMAENKLLPYLDIPFQHSHPEVLKRMQRPARKDNSLKLIEEWRRIKPDITLRSTFIVGYPGENRRRIPTLTRLVRRSSVRPCRCFKYENVKGARSNDLPGHLPEEIKEERWKRFMIKAQGISERKLLKKLVQFKR